jgi:exodeoxyribonuclease V alpha subunit
LKTVKTRIPRRFGLDPIRDIQVLCPMNRGGVGARSLNIELQAALNPAGERKVERFGWTFAPGDKVMQVENDCDKEVYNGDIGYVKDVDPDGGELTASFDGRSVVHGFGELDTLVPAYAATIHKSQGSEYPAIVIPIMTQHYTMLQRNLLYTGVTRGKRLVDRRLVRLDKQACAEVFQGLTVGSKFDHRSTVIRLTAVRGPEVIASIDGDGIDRIPGPRR